ncbi:hypothetical protein [Desulfosediminicola ganghwensis]|uniref:hypothetical protein n=1 Tax=Desulfosediminicola ganghwensis TaxID=2569540 RepID=UPI00113829AB|nr:hypothetical protein [Desulfosediminicola ganghwensis]
MQILVHLKDHCERGNYNQACAILQQKDTPQIDTDNTYHTITNSYQLQHLVGDIFNLRFYHSAADEGSMRHPHYISKTKDKSKECNLIIFEDEAKIVSVTIGYCIEKAEA